MVATKIVILGMATAIAAAGCGSTADTQSPGPAPSVSAGAKLFSEPFDDDKNGWGVGDHPENGSMSYSTGDYVWAFKGRVAHWLPEALGKKYDRGQLDMLDVVVRAQVTIVRGGGVVGIGCRENRDSDADYQWYDFVARDGYAAIRRADLESNIDVLAEAKDVALPAGKPIEIEAACVNDGTGAGRLSLRLNGDVVLHATDPQPLGNGVPSLQAWTHPVHEQMDIRWHEFTVLRAELGRDAG